jgi:AAA+ superfamily predicted ATPase
MSDLKEFNERVGRAVSDSRKEQARIRPTLAKEAIDLPATKSYKAANNRGDGRWGISGDDYYGVNDSSDSLDPGLYVCRYSDTMGAYLAKQPINVDDLIRLPDNASQEVISEVVHFSTLADRFREFGFLYKRGIMLWGPPGSGKTSTIQLLIELFVNNLDGIALQIQNPELAADCIRLIRRIEPDRQILALMEDLDALVSDYGENAFLSLLDGENQTKNVVFVATTNYPERLDKRFVDRPSRFDTIKYVGMPSAIARECYFKAKMPNIDSATLDKYVAKTEGYSVAHMKETVILTQCFGKTLDEAINTLDAMIDRQPTSDRTPDKKHNFGFVKN